jgi:hypothetical protein
VKLWNAAVPSTRITKHNAKFFTGSALNQYGFFLLARFFVRRLSATLLPSVSEDMTMLFAVVFFWIAEPFEAMLPEVLPVLLSLISSVVDPLSKSLSDPLATMLQDD